MAGRKVEKKVENRNSPPTVWGLQVALREHAEPEYIPRLKGFFKTGKGEYGEGDIFMGVKSPPIRKLAQGGRALGFSGVGHLLGSPLHEERLLGLMILVEKYKLQEREMCAEGQRAIYLFYCKHLKEVNNWDLVDMSCPYIVGKYLLKRRGERKVLLDWAASPHLWTRRIAVVSNWWLIRNGDLSMVFRVARVLMGDKEDLIHKAVGWMIREAGKKDLQRMEDFLQRNGHKMPRVMLRYAIERLSRSSKKRYLGS